MSVSLRVNGESVSVASDPRTLLLDVLREEMGLRGTKYGCGEGECGACTVLLDGRTVNACLMTLGQAAGADVVTVEAMANDPIGAPLLESLAQAGAVQCGFCTPGFVLSARALLAEHAAPADTDIQRGLSGNLCRCTGYAKIVEAVRAAGRVGPNPPSPFPNRDPSPLRYEGRGGASSAQFTHSSRADFKPGEYAQPTSVEDALALLAPAEQPWKVLAGGTDLLVRNEHHLKELALLDLSALDELRGITEDEASIRIGALKSYTAIARSPLVQRWANALTQAAVEVGGVQIQNMATLAGNLVNASPAADGVPPLFVLGASVKLRSVRGARQVPVEALASGPGRTVIAPDELLTEIVIPKVTHAGEELTFFEKVGPRKAQTIAKASVALRGWLQDGALTNVRVALGAVAPTVMLAPQTAQVLMAGPLTQARLLAAGDAACGECQPIDDVRSTAAYRRKLVRGILVRRLWPHGAV